MATHPHTKLSPTTVFPPAYDEIDFQAHDYVIGGKLVVGKAVLGESFVALIDGLDHDARMHLKKKLVMDMATYMLENQLVEFTQMDDPLTLDKTVMVRAYLAPSEQVKILRLANKIV